MITFVSVKDFLKRFVDNTYSSALKSESVRKELDQLHKLYNYDEHIKAIYHYTYTELCRSLKQSLEGEDRVVIKRTYSAFCKLIWIYEEADCCDEIEWFKKAVSPLITGADSHFDCYDMVLNTDDVIDKESFDETDVSTWESLDFKYNQLPVIQAQRIFMLCLAFDLLNKRTGRLTLRDLSHALKVKDYCLTYSLVSHEIQFAIYSNHVEDKKDIFELVSDKYNDDIETRVTSLKTKQKITVEAILKFINRNSISGSRNDVAKQLSSSIGTLNAFIQEYCEMSYPDIKIKAATFDPNSSNLTNNIYNRLKRNLPDHTYFK